MSTNNDFNTYVEKMKTTKITTVSSSARVGNSICSFGVVYNKNGKRLSFSKGLATKLGLVDTVDVIPHSAEGVVHLGKDLSGLDGVSTCQLKGDESESRISYAAGMAQIIAEEYGLDFKAHTSYAFQNISFSEYNGLPVATVHICNPKSDGESA